MKCYDKFVSVPFIKKIMVSIGNESRRILAEVSRQQQQQQWKPQLMLNNTEIVLTLF